jgi:mannose-6-phosphate isomerase-like protein (cupin superfamily)
LIVNASTIEGNATKGNVNNTLPELKAFKRTSSLGLYQWENGNLTTNLAEKKDTNGAFFLVEAMLAPGTEPPPHVHSREDELFYVLEGEFDVYVGEQAFKVETGECVFLPRFKPHASASPAHSVHPRRDGRSLPRHGFARPKSRPSYWGAHLFEGRFEADGGTI